MPNLDAGESAKIVLGPSDSVRVSTGGQASVLAISGAPAGTTTVTAQTRDFGPYNVAAVLRITGVSGSTSYGTVDPVPLSNNETAATRALVSRAGIGYSRATFVGDSIAFAGVRYGAQVPTGLIFSNGVNLFLASLYTNTAGTGTIEWSLPLRSLRYTAPGDTAGPWVPMTRSQRFRIPSANGLWLEGSFFNDIMATLASTSSNVTYTGSPSHLSASRGIAEWLRFLSYGRLLVNNLCAPGAALRHLPDILQGLPSNPGLVVVQIGTNDVIGARTPAQIAADFEAVAPTLASIGAMVCSIPALAWGSTAQRNAWNAVNTSVVPAICAQYGITFAPIWGATVDPSSTTAPKAGRLQGDNVHPANSAACFAALNLQPLVSPISGTALTQSPVAAHDAVNNPNGNLCGNVGFTGTTGEVSGTNVSAGAGGVPTGYSVVLSGTVTSCVVQIVPASDGGNPWLEFAITGASAGATIRLEFGSISLANFPGSVIPTPGQAMEATVEWQYVAGSGGALRGVDARLLPVTVAAPIGYSFFVLDSLPLPDVNLQGITPPTAMTPWTMPAGATAVRWQAFITMSAGNATVRMRNPVMRIVV